MITTNESEPLLPVPIWKKLFRRRHYKGEQVLVRPASSHCQTERWLNWYHLLFFGVITTIGSGINNTMGRVIGVGGLDVGSGVTICFLLDFIVTLMGAIIFVEFASRFQESGSAYTYVYETIGEFMGWIAGIALFYEFVFSAATCANAWALNFYLIMTTSNLNINFPDYLVIASVNIFLQFVPVAAWIVFFGTVLLICFFRNKISRYLFFFFFIFDTFLMLFIIVCGAFFVTPSNIKTSFPKQHGDQYQKFTNNYGFGAEPDTIAALFRGTGILFFSFSGFDKIATLASETINPKRSIPVGIFGSLVLVLVFYEGVSLVVVGIGSTPLNSTLSPIAWAFRSQDEDVAAIVSFVGSFVALFAVVYTNLAAGPRLLLQMSQDGLLPHCFSRTYKNIPLIGITFTGLISCLVAAWLPYTSLSNLGSIFALVVYSFLAFAIIILRLHPSRHVPVEDWESEKKWYKQPRYVVHLTIVYLFLCALIGGLWHPNKKGFTYSSFALLILAFFVYLILQVQTKYDSPNTFACPVPSLPCLVLLCNMWMLLTMPYIDLVFALLLLLVPGLPLYFLYSVKHSLLNSRREISLTSPRLSP
eukprot:TRINITY_DN5408_c0_g1_i1.p1 TRINITY_DN5408_c0_g1~~TRINITY_DN5408_c0_g1_i1.p1  ORF type:complete len:588 (+),score=60.88 TRINITY_DN5408_c0_g1_i1:79-1842(+)